MEAAIKRLKLNAKNINSTLISGNKTLKKLRADEKTLFNKQRVVEKRIQKESFVEGGAPGSGAVGGVARKMAAPAMSLFDKLKNFAATVLVGLLVNKLPFIIERVKKFLNDNAWLFKSIGEVFKFTGDLFMVLVDLYNFFNPAKKAQLEAEKKQLNAQLNALVGQVDDMGGVAREADSAVDKFVGDQLRERNPEQVRNDVVTAFKNQKLTEQNFTATRLAISRAQRDKDEPVQLSVPGVGNFTRVKDNSIFGIFRRSGMKETATDIYGYQITTEEFQKRASIGYRVAEGFDTDIVKDLKAAGIPGFSQGGTVRPAATAGGSFPGESAPLKKALASTQTFSVFENNEFSRSSLIDLQEDTNETFNKLIKNFEELYLKEETLPESSPYELPKTPPGSPPQQGPTILRPGISTSEIIGYVGNTGLSGGPHIHIEDYLSGGKAIPDDVKNNILVNGVPMSSGVLTSGIGMRIHPITGQRRMHQGEDWDNGWMGQPISLRGGLKFVDYFSQNSNEGQTRFYGYGNVTVIEDAAGRKFFLAHLDSGPSNIKKLRQLQSKPPAGGTNIKPGQVVSIPPGSGIRLEPVEKSGKPEGGGYVSPKGSNKSKLNNLTQYFDGEGMTEVIIINSTQPIIVPGPTRYIRR